MYPNLRAQAETRTRENQLAMLGLVLVAVQMFIPRKHALRFDEIQCLSISGDVDNWKQFKFKEAQSEQMTVAVQCWRASLFWRGSDASKLGLVPKCQFEKLGALEFQCPVPVSLHSPCTSVPPLPITT